MGLGTRGKRPGDFRACAVTFLSVINKLTFLSVTYIPKCDI